MTYKQCSRLVSRPLLLFLILMLASTASAEWKEKVLYSFQGLPDGSVPAGGVVFDTHGNLYGATTEGGANSCPGIAQCGTVYQLTPPATKGDAWTETVLYTFLGKNHNDGNTPAGGVMIDAAGNLYGTTAYGGAGSCILLGTNVGCGTVYELSPPTQKGGAWRETVLYSFKGDTDGQLPIGDLVFDKQGNLHGATQYGGGYGSCNPSFYQHCGTVFKLSPPKTKGGKWTEKVLHGFKGGMDGANPNGGLVFDGTGAIYGTTSAGGNTNCTGAGFVVRHCVRAGISHRERRCVWRKDPPSLPELPHRRGTPVSWPDVRWQWLPLRYYRRWRRLRRGNSIQIGTTSKGR